MRTWLKRMVAVIVSAGTLMGGGLLMAGTANADEIRMPDIGKTITSTARTIAGKSGSLPTELVNGSFSYKGRQCLDTARKAAGNDYQSDWNFANIDYVKGDAGAARKWAHIDGFQATGFGWKSNQTDTAVDGRAPIAEIQQSRDGSNYYGEITASQANTYLYQDINTRHDFSTVYTVKLKHASRTLAMGVDSLQVLVGTPGHERPVELTRIASDGKDQVGEKSNVVASAVSGWNGKWDTYMGSVTIPANQPVTRFTFKSITGIDNVAGNLIDDVRFAYAYPLSYDANGGTKQQASQISSKTFGKASETDGKAEQPAGTVVFTASKYGTPVVTWTFKNDSATDPDKPADPGTDALKNVAATADGKPIAGFDPTRDGAYKVAAGAKVRISDVPSDWKLDKTESGSKLVFTASKGGTAVTWTFEYQANGGSSATDPGNGGGSNAGGDGQGDPGKTPDTSKPAASPKPAGTADDGQAAGAAPLASTGAGTGPAIAVAGLLAMAGASLLAAVARTRRHGADPDGLTAD